MNDAADSVNECTENNEQVAMGECESYGESSQYDDRHAEKNRHHAEDVLRLQSLLEEEDGEENEEEILCANEKFRADRTGHFESHEDE